MKKMRVTIVLLLAGMAVSQTAPQQQAQPQTQPSAGQPATGQAAAGQQAAPQQQKKEIKNPAEYNAYVGAIQQTDPASKISGLEAFLQQYPQSVMKEDALEALMIAYQQTGNADKMNDAAQRLLQVNPDNVRALALLAYTRRAAAQAGQNPQQNLADAQKYGQQGIQAIQKFAKPEGMSDADYEKLKKEMGGIFNGAVGIAALQNKDFTTAQNDLKVAAEVSPTDFSIVYPLALAYLQANPADVPNGAWYAARAANIAPNPQLSQQIEKYGKSQYTKYHGSDQGWTEVMAAAKASPTPPAGFSITQYIPPTPAQQAADLVKNKQPKDMSFAEWELVLSAGVQSDADTVWNAIKGKALQMEGQVIHATSDKIEIAASQDDIDQKRADIILQMTGTIPARLMPKDGATLDFEGTPASYTASPFVMTMEKGALLTKATPKATPKRPVHRRPTKPQ
ncbi:MAG TPA: hypothetical protein VMT53_00125 [Terriglobales bacterium]|nr:hypothetical protein [Terriglobales bacterium]